MRQPFREHDRLVVPARIRQLDDAHLAAGARAPLGARHHGTGDPAGAAARAHGARKLGPGLHPHAFENGGIVVQRMAGEKETDRAKLLLQPLRGQPWFDLSDRKRRARGPAPEQLRLAD